MIRERIDQDLDLLAEVLGQLQAQSGLLAGRDVAAWLSDDDAEHTR